MCTRGPEVLFFGAGEWGRNVIDSFVECGAVPRGFLVRGNPDTRKWVSDRFPDAAIDDDAAGLLASQHAPVVVVATPRDTHAELAELALRAGRDVFVEKPMATDPADCRRLTALADDANAALFTGFTYLYHPAFAQLSEAVAPEDIAELSFTWNRPRLRGPVEWELLPHDLALAIRLTGRIPEQVHLSVADEGMQCSWAVDRKCTVHLHFNGAGSGTKDKRVRLVTTRGVTWQWHGNHLARWESGDQSTEPDFEIEYGPREPLLREVSWFLEHLADRAAMRRDAALSSSVTELISSALTMGGSSCR